MKRSEFLRLCGGALLLTQLPKPLIAKVNAGAEAGNAAEGPSSLKDVRKITINVGATKPFSALHLSDTHLTRIDERDNERKKRLSLGRQRVFPWAEHYFDAAIRYAREHDLMMLHTGDLIDFVSDANLDFVAIQLGVGDWFASAGNHEYSQYVGEAKEDAAYKAQSFDKVQRAYPNDLKVASRVINGVNFVALDDVYYNVTSEQHELMRREVEKGLPIVLLCHVPFYTPKHCADVLKGNNGLAGYVTGAPLEITRTYQTNPSLPADEQWRNRSVQQHSDEPTLEFIAWLKQQPLLKAILCGHCHHFYEEQFSPTATQYIVGAGYNGAAYEVEFR